jgi:hypothetical protein
MATKTAGSIKVNLTADTIQYVQKMKAAAHLSEKKLKGMERDIKRLQVTSKKGFSAVGGAMAKMKTGLLAGALAFGALTVAGSKARIETEKLAKIAGMSGDKFQSVAIAFNSVGIGADKAADTFRELNLKIAEAALLGSGAAKEAFDELGISMNTIKDKSPEDQMLMINERMQSLNLTGSEQGVIWDSLASDMDLMKPLLKDGAKGYKDLVSAADKLDVKLPKSSIDGLKQIALQSDLAKNNILDFGAYMGGQFTQAFSDIQKPIFDVIDGFIKWNEETNAIKRVVEGLSSTFGMLKDTVDIAFLLMNSQFQNVKYIATGFFDYLVFGAKSIYKDFKFMGDNIKTTFTVMLTNLKNKFQEFMIKIGEGIAMMPGFEADGEAIANGARMAIEANNEVAKGALDILAEHKKTQIKDLNDFNNMRDQKAEEWVAKQKEIAQRIVKNATDIGAGAFDLVGAVTGNMSPETSVLNAPDALLEDGSTEGNNAKVEAEQTMLNKMMDLHDKYNEDRTAADQLLAKSDEGRGLAAVDGFAASLGMKLDAYGIFTKAMAMKDAITAGMQVWSDSSLSFYEKIPAAVAVASTTAGLMGQFHDGNDNVKSEGSYLLSQGERVVQPKANKDLTKFLAGQGGGEGTVINSTINMGPSLVDDNVFAQALKRQQSNLAGLVRKEEQKRPTRRTVKKQ